MQVHPIFVLKINKSQDQFLEEKLEKEKATKRNGTSRIRLGSLYSRIINELDGKNVQKLELRFKKNVVDLMREIIFLVCPGYRGIVDDSLP